MQLKVWLLCKHPSHLGIQSKHPVYKNLVRLCKFIIPCCSGTSGFIGTMSKWQKLWQSKESAWPSWETTISSWSVQFETALTHIQTLSTYVLPSFTHFSHFVAHGRPSQKHVPRLLKSNAHMLVQSSTRCVPGIHCKYVHVVYIYIYIYVCVCVCVYIYTTVHVQIKGTAMGS